MTYWCYLFHQNQWNHSLMMKNMRVTVLPNEAGSTDDADCVWVDGLSRHPTSVSASWPLSPESGCWCLGQTLRMAPQSLTVNGWDWLNTLATLWCRGRLVKAALLVGVLGSMSRAECAACVSCERQSSVDINKSYIVIKRLAMFRCHMKCKLFYLKCTGLVPLVVD